ncbi:unnamed protein product [Arabis nemorensis]|uniref:Uncharacterized protein n=1 Tax=Arabis nemorensis TaxID=586526 RepID=A0A565BSK9_9BRAS|nr:unnamed protein product [Arabis nemorensis]
MNYLERFIAKRYKFTKEIWKGGADNWPVIEPDSKLSKKEKIQGKVHQKRTKNVKGDKPFFSKADKGKRILELVDKKNEAHWAELKEMWSLEKKIMKDELVDEIISILRDRGKYPCPKCTDKSNSPVRDNSCNSKTKSGNVHSGSSVIDQLNLSIVDDDGQKEKENVDQSCGTQLAEETIGEASNSHAKNALRFANLRFDNSVVIR